MLVTNKVINTSHQQSI